MSQKPASANNQVQQKISSLSGVRVSVLVETNSSEQKGSFIASLKLAFYVFYTAKHNTKQLKRSILCFRMSTLKAVD